MISVRPPAKIGGGERIDEMEDKINVNVGDEVIVKER